MKTLKKTFILIILMALLMVLTIPVMGGAFAEETETTVVAEVDTTEITNELTNKVVAIVGGIGGGSVLILFIGVLMPYLKKKGELATIKALYTKKKEEAETAIKNLDIEKEKADFLKAVPAMLENVAKQTATTVAKELFTYFDNKTDQSGQALANTEIITAKLDALLKAASLAWQGAEGAPQLLAQSPTHTAYTKALDEIQQLKTFIINKLEISSDDLKAMIKEA